MLARFRVAAELTQASPPMRRRPMTISPPTLARRDLVLAAIRRPAAGGQRVSPTCAKAEPLAEPSCSFPHTARELLALSAWHNHDIAATRRYLDMIASDAETPASTRARIDVLSALIASGGKS